MHRVLWLLFLSAAAAAAAERINHEGRILGDLPAVTQPLLFNTPAADSVVAAMQIMPRDSPWNENISTRPVLSNSNAMIARITADLDPARRNLRLFEEMNYVLVPENQPAIPIEFFEYPDESDLEGGVFPVGLYPVPPNLPVETWPTGTGTLTLEEWQQDLNGDGGDRHSIIVKPGSGKIWETWLTKRTGTTWEAANGATFSLNSNALRPAGWTSADAAGLPMFPALVRYDECQRGMVEHAIRIVVRRTRSSYIYPATHQASSPSTSDPDVPAMGQRLRLKSSFVIPSNWTLQEKAVLLGLKKYGAFVADNGNFFSISITPDDRYPEDCFSHLGSLTVSNFEVIETTGPTAGPRSPGAPSALAGGDRSIPTGTPLTLDGSITATLPVTVQWRKASGPGSVTFGNPAAAVTTAAFSLPGDYLLLLSADDGVHAVAYDAVRISVILPVTTGRSGSDAWVEFPTALGKSYRVEHSGNLQDWTDLAASLPGTGAVLRVKHPNAPPPKRFYRVSVTE